jgi:hypothetical protein
VVARAVVWVPAIFERGDDRAGQDVFAVQDAFTGLSAARVPDISQLLHQRHAVAVPVQCMFFKGIHFLINVRHISSVSKRQLSSGGRPRLTEIVQKWRIAGAGTRSFDKRSFWRISAFLRCVLQQEILLHHQSLRDC